MPAHDIATRIATLTARIRAAQVASAPSLFPEGTVPQVGQTVCDVRRGGSPRVVAKVADGWVWFAGAGVPQPVAAFGRGSAWRVCA